MNEEKNVTTVEPKLFPLSSYLAQRAALEREIRLDFWTFLTDTSKELFSSCCHISVRSLAGSIVSVYAPRTVVVVVVSVVVVKGNPKATHFIHQVFFLLSRAIHKKREL